MQCFKQKNVFLTSVRRKNSAFAQRFFFSPSEKARGSSSGRFLNLACFLVPCNGGGANLFGAAWICQSKPALVFYAQVSILERCLLNSFVQFGMVPQHLDKRLRQLFRVMANDVELYTILNNDCIADEIRLDDLSLVEIILRSSARSSRCRRRTGRRWAAARATRSRPS